MASVVCSACRDNSLSFAIASSAGSACELAAISPDIKVKLAIAPAMGRLIRLVGRCARSCLKFSSSQLAMASRLELLLGLR
jgi:hypothetical protein